MVQFATELSEQFRKNREPRLSNSHKKESTHNDSFREAGIALLIQNRQQKFQGRRLERSIIIREMHR